MPVARETQMAALLGQSEGPRAQPQRWPAAALAASAEPVPGYQAVLLVLHQEYQAATGWTCHVQQSI